MKLNWRKIFLVGNGFLGITVIWQIYNAFVPIFFQTGLAERHIQLLLKQLSNNS